MSYTNEKNRIEKDFGIFSKKRGRYAFSKN